MVIGSTWTRGNRYRSYYAYYYRTCTYYYLIDLIRDIHTYNYIGGLFSCYNKCSQPLAISKLSPVPFLTPTPYSNTKKDSISPVFNPNLGVGEQSAGPHVFWMNSGVNGVMAYYYCGDIGWYVLY
jgi:hypothetical protein